MPLKVKWGKTILEPQVDPATTLGDLKALLEAQTGVPADRQRLMGLSSEASDSTPLSTVWDGKKPLLLIGSAEPLTVKPSSESKPTTTEAVVPNYERHDGLKNLGNTCYLNAAVQLLRVMPKAMDVLRATAGPVAKSLAGLMADLDRTPTAIAALAFWTSFITSYPNFMQMEQGVPMQQDSQEALSILLSLMTPTLELPPFKPYERMYQGTFRQTTTSPEGRHDAQSVPFSILPCNISADTTTLEFGLKASLESTMVDESTRTVLQRTQRLAVLPEFLFINLLRFTWRQDVKGKAKILRDVAFPMVLDVLPFCTDELQAAMEPQRAAIRQRRDVLVENRKRQRQKSGEELQPIEPFPRPEELGNTNGYYELCGVISHKGRSADGGHYVSWTKQGGEWFVHDDANVAHVTEQDVLRLRGSVDQHIAYVLLYRSRDPDTGEPPLQL